MSTQRYQAYLLRLWQERSNGPWRATLEDPRRGRRYGFGSLEELVAFLEGTTGRPLRPVCAGEEGVGVPAGEASSVPDAD